jgi:protein tyrosine/serine phosphatase
VPRERRLCWDGCLNARDLGGLATQDGGETRFGAVARADSLGRLSEAGWRALVAYGVSRIVDLRDGSELDDDPVRGASVEVVHVPLLQTLDPDAYAEARREASAMPDAADAKARVYAAAVEHCRPGFADALRAVAEAPPGTVVVHCWAGADRTGLVVALLLRVCGVPSDAVDADYAASAPHLSEEWVAAAPDAEERARRRRLASPAGAMTRTLDALERRYESVDAYLAGAGLSGDTRARLRLRLAA